MDNYDSGEIRDAGAQYVPSITDQGAVLYHTQNHIFDNFVLGADAHHERIPLEQMPDVAFQQQENTSGRNAFTSNRAATGFESVGNPPNMAFQQQGNPNGNHAFTGHKAAPGLENHAILPNVLFQNLENFHHNNILTVNPPFVGFGNFPAPPSTPFKNSQSFMANDTGIPDTSHQSRAGAGSGSRKMSKAPRKPQQEAQIQTLRKENETLQTQLQQCREELTKKEQNILETLKCDAIIKAHYNMIRGYFNFTVKENGRLQPVVPGTQQEAMLFSKGMKSRAQIEHETTIEQLRKHCTVVGQCLCMLCPQHNPANRALIPPMTTSVKPPRQIVTVDLTDDGDCSTPTEVGLTDKDHDDRIAPVRAPAPVGEATAAVTIFTPPSTTTASAETTPNVRIEPPATKRRRVLKDKTFMSWLTPSENPHLRKTQGLLPHPMTVIAKMKEEQVTAARARAAEVEKKAEEQRPSAGASARDDRPGVGGEDDGDNDAELEDVKLDSDLQARIQPHGKEEVNAIPKSDIQARSHPPAEKDQEAEDPEDAAQDFMDCWNAMDESGPAEEKMVDDLDDLF